MEQISKKIGNHFIYLSLIAFLIVAYIFKSGFFDYFLPKTNTVKQNIIEMEFKEPQFTADFSKSATKVVEIADFEENEKWTGDYRLDDTVVFEGNTSLSLVSNDRENSSVSLAKNLDLTNSKLVKMLIYSPNENNSQNVKNLTLIFGNSDGTVSYEYPIVYLKPGWNVVRMPLDTFLGNTKTLPKEETTPADKNKTDDSKIIKSNNQELNWKNIRKVTLELSSRPNLKVNLNFDRIWAEENEDYAEDFRTTSPNVINLKSFENKPLINVWALGSNMALLKKISSVKNFKYTAKIIPQKKGSFGINSRTNISNSFGYYFEIGGIDLSTWKLYKVGKRSAIGNDSSPITILDMGEIGNYIVETDKPIFPLTATTSPN